MAAPEEASVQGKLKRVIHFGGTQGENYSEWAQEVECYLEEWVVFTHCSTEQAHDASALLKYNSKCVYTYLTLCCTGRAKSKICTVAVGKDPKKAWDEIKLEFDKRVDIDIESLIGEWFETKLSSYQDATKYIDQLQDLNNQLHRRGKELGESQTLSKVKRDLIRDPRYSKLICSSLLNEAITFSTLKLGWHLKKCIGGIFGQDSCNH
jgi:hypothetical protein